ncbi:MAG TPA: DUF4192 domain-containing protein [Galbitalea sp.]
MSVILKAHNPADLLAMLPSLVGFAPRESIVLLAFRGKRTCGAIRYDLPKSSSATVQKRVATFMIGTLCKLRGVDAVIPVICTGDAFGADGTPPAADFAQVLGRRLRQSGFELRDLLCQASDGWVSYLEDDPPAGGHPLSDIADSFVHDEVPPELRGRASPFEQPSRVPDADESHKDRVMQELAHLRGLMDDLDRDDAWDDDAATIELQPLADLPQLMEDALGWDVATVDANDALLLFAWQGPPVRDMTMLQWATHRVVGDLTLDENDSMRDGHGGHPDAHQLLGDLMLGIGPQPDPARIHRGIELLRTVVSRADDAERPPLLCMLTWLSWALGHGTAAGRYVDEARAIRPDYGMVEVLDTMLSNGMLPEWAFAGAGDSRE